MLSVSVADCFIHRFSCIASPCESPITVQGMVQEVFVTFVERIFDKFCTVSRVWKSTEIKKYNSDNTITSRNFKNTRRKCLAYALFEAVIF